MEKRIIKFRVWDIEYKKWANDSLCFAIGRLSESANEKGYILSQFTGLYDVNGKEIFEGDILEYENEKIVVESPRWYSCDAFTEYGYHNLGSFQDDYSNEQETSRIIRGGQVIGNIYEDNYLFIK